MTAYSDGYDYAQAEFEQRGGVIPVLIRVNLRARLLEARDALQDEGDYCSCPACSLHWEVVGYCEGMARCLGQEITGKL